MALNGERKRWCGCCLFDRSTTAPTTTAPKYEPPPATTTPPTESSTRTASPTGEAGAGRSGDTDLKARLTTLRDSILPATFYRMMHELDQILAESETATKAGEALESPTTPLRIRVPAIDIGAALTIKRLELELLVSYPTLDSLSTVTEADFNRFNGLLLNHEFALSTETDFINSRGSHLDKRMYLPWIEGGQARRMATYQSAITTLNSIFNLKPEDIMLIQKSGINAENGAFFSLEARGKDSPTACLLLYVPTDTSKAATTLIPGTNLFPSEPAKEAARAQFADTLRWLNTGINEEDLYLSGGYDTPGNTPTPSPARPPRPNSPTGSERARSPLIP